MFIVKATDNVLLHGNVTIEENILTPIRFSKELLKTLETKSANSLQLKIDTYPYSFLSNNLKLITSLRNDLNKLFDADLVIKTDCYEVKRRNERSLNSETQNDSNQQWTTKLNQFLDNYSINKFNQYIFSNTQLLLNEINWNSLTNSCSSRYMLTESIKLVSIS